MKFSKLLQYHFFIPDFNLLSCELDYFTFKVFIESFYIDLILKQQNKIMEHAVAKSYDEIHNTFTVP